MKLSRSDRVHVFPLSLQIYRPDTLGTVAGVLVSVRHESAGEDGAQGEEIQRYRVRFDDGVEMEIPDLFLRRAPWAASDEPGEGRPRNGLWGCRP